MSPNTKMDDGVPSKLIKGYLVSNAPTLTTT